LAQLIDKQAKIDALRSFWMAILCVYVTQGMPKIAIHPIPDISISWSDVISKITPTDDEHILKLAFVCREEDKEFPSPLYRQTAMKTLEQVTTLNWSYSPESAE